MTPSEKCEHCGEQFCYCPDRHREPLTTEEAKCSCLPPYQKCNYHKYEPLKQQPTSEPREPYLDEDHLYRKYEALKRANDRNMRVKFEWRDEADSLRTELAEAKAGRIEALNAYEHMVNCHSDRVKELDAERAKAEKLEEENKELRKRLEVNNE